MDYAATHRVTRITDTPVHALRITFNRAGQTLTWECAKDGGTPRDVTAAVAEAIAADRSLASHFRVESIEPLATAAAESSPEEAPVTDAADASAVEHPARRLSRRERRKLADKTEDAGT